MVRCVVQEADRPPCGALVFLREREKHLEEIHHTLTPRQRRNLRRWFVEPENPKPVPFDQKPPRSKL